MGKKILFIGGTLNQNTMVHRVAEALQDCECWFTPFYGDGLLEWMAKQGLLEFSILGRQQQQAGVDYFQKKGLLLDVGGKRHNYDLVVMANDAFLPKNVRFKKIILVQEGMASPAILSSPASCHMNMPLTSTTCSNGPTLNSSWNKIASIL